ncbi:MAG: hypothetical protein KBS55_03625 [Bacteroidales bacterium]|nr:hypothetical protein [Candidatus Cryptobacteroides aphodequi]
MKFKALFAAAALLAASGLATNAQTYIVDVPGMDYTIAHTDKYFVPGGIVSQMDKAISKHTDDTLHLANGTQVKFVSLGFAEKERKKPAEIRYQGKTYYVYARDLKFSEKNAKGVKDPLKEVDFSPASRELKYVDADGHEQVKLANTIDRHSEDGHNLYGFDNIKAMLFLLVMAYALLGLGFLFKKVRPIKYIMLTLSAFALTGLLVAEIWTIFRLGTDFTWWMDPDILPKKTCILRSVLLLAAVFAQFWSANLFQALIDYGRNDKTEFSHFTILVVMGIAFIPVVVGSYFLVNWITGYDSATADLDLLYKTWLLWGVIVFGVLLIASIIASALEYKWLGIVVGLFYTVFWIGTAAVLFILFAALIKLAIAVLLQFFVFAFLLKFAGSDFVKDMASGSSSSQPVTMYYDADGHAHNNAVDAEYANKAIAERKANE